MITDRKTFIGGSDIAGVMGLSRWCTPLRLYALKTGLIPEKDLSDVEEVQTGIDLEEYVTKRFTKATGYKLRRDQRDFTHAKYPYMKAHIDRWILGEDALFEAKTTSAYNLKEWDGDSIPQEYILQVMWYCGILKKSVGYIAVLIGGQKFRWKKVEFDQELFNQMIESARVFWEEFVQRKIAPIAVADDDDETLGLLYPNANDVIVKLEGDNADHINKLIEERLGGLEQAKLVEEEINSLSAQIKQVIGEAQGLTTGQYQATWKPQVKTYPDSEKMKADMVFLKYKKETTFRVLRTKKLKGEEK